MNAIDLLAAKAKETSATGQFDPKSAEPVPSPCISVCRMTEDRSRCEGCFRTIDEIRAWAAADSTQRRAIWVQLLQRAGADVPETLAR